LDFNLTLNPALNSELIGEPIETWAHDLQWQAHWVSLEEMPLEKLSI